MVSAVRGNITSYAGGGFWGLLKTYFFKRSCLEEIAYFTCKQKKKLGEKFLNFTVLVEVAYK